MFVIQFEMLLVIIYLILLIPLYYMLIKVIFALRHEKKQSNKLKLKKAYDYNLKVNSESLDVLVEKFNIEESVSNDKVIPGIDIVPSNHVNPGKIVMVASNTLATEMGIGTPIVGIARSEPDENGRLGVELSSQIGIDIIEPCKYTYLEIDEPKKLKKTDISWLQERMGKSFVGSLNKKE